MTFRADINTSIGWNWSQGASDNGRLNDTRTLLEGNGDGQAEAVWHIDGETLQSGTAKTLDLTSLQRTILSSSLTTTLLRVKAIFVVNDATSAGDLVLGGADAAQWFAPFGASGETVRLPPDGSLLLSNRRNGWAVDAQNKMLKLLAADGNVTFRLVLLGTLTAP
jgi:hypothetical protein